MTINSDYTRMNPVDPTSGSSRPNAAHPRRAKTEPSPPEEAKGASGPSAPEVHDAGRLRDSVTRLIRDGDLSARTGGAVRLARVAEARLNVEQDAYSQTDVLASIVDRLLDQWKI